MNSQLSETRYTKMDYLVNMNKLQIEQLMVDVAKQVDVMLPPCTGFILLTATFGSGRGPIHYVGGGSTKAFIKMLRETADKLEAELEPTVEFKVITEPTNKYIIG
jgi:hypothetical protein